MRARIPGRNHGYLEGVGGLRLHYRTWDPEQPRAGILLVHGLGEHGGRYAWLAESLAGHGFATFALDLRGHGSSDGRRGHVPRFDIFLQDLDRFRREARGLLDPDCPLFLFGHSVGGLIVLRYLQEFDASIRGAVLSSPWLAADAPLSLRGRILAATLGRILPAIRLPLRLDAGQRDAPGRAPDAPRDDDSLAHTAATPRLVHELRAAAALARGRAGRVRAPVLILLGEEDRLVDPSPTLELARSLGDVGVRLRRYPGRGHELVPSDGAGGELADLVAWLDARIEAPAAGMAGEGGIRLAPRRRTHQPGAGA